MTELPGEPVWIELFTADPERAASFYGALLGWTVHDPGPEYGGYLLFHRDGAPVAGCMVRDASDTDDAGSGGADTDTGTDTWSVYLETTDATAAAAAAEEHGGRVVVPPMAVGDLGSMVVLEDPGGATVGGWQPGSHAGFAARGEVGAPTWFDLLTTAYPESIGFYERVFGWRTDTMSDTAEFRYTTLGSGDDARAGIMDGSGFLAAMRTPSHWQLHLRVADADAAAESVTMLGGEQVTPLEDSPYGRLCRVADPGGATFMVMAHPA